MRIRSTPCPRSGLGLSLLSPTTSQFARFDVRGAIGVFTRASVALALVLTACDDGGPTGAPSPASVVSVEVTPAAPSLASIDETISLTATPRDAEGNAVEGKSVVWTSSDADVAGVDEAGLAVAIANGTTTISAQVDDIVGTTTLTVNQQPVALRIATEPAGAGAGVPFATQPSVEIVDANGKIVEENNETVVKASMESGPGGLVGEVTATAKAGVATFTDLGVKGQAGERTLAFESGELSRAVSAPFVLGAGSAVALARESGDGQVAPADTELPTPLAVIATDNSGNAVAGVAVTWTVVEGGGSLSSAEKPTNDNGISQVTYRLGRYAGPARVEASVSSLEEGSPITFEFTATPNGRITGTITVNDQGLPTPTSGNLHARLIDPATGATVATVAADEGSYSFTGLDDGEYIVFAGQDENGNGVIGVPVRPWGAAGGAATPTVLTVDGAGDYPASFEIGLPVDDEPNNDPGTVDALPVGGYITGSISDPVTDLDAYRVLIPATGSYVFETFGIEGPCGSGPEADTLLGLFDDSVISDDYESIPPIAENDDINASSKCSRITETLEPGIYFIGVYGYNGGRYAVSVREEQ